MTRVLCAEKQTRNYEAIRLKEDASNIDKVSAWLVSKGHENMESCLIAPGGKSLVYRMKNLEPVHLTAGGWVVDETGFGDFEAYSDGAFREEYFIMAVYE